MGCRNKVKRDLLKPGSFLYRDRFLLPDRLGIDHPALRCSAGARVTLDMTTLTIMRVLPREVDPLVYNMAAEDPGKVHCLPCITQISLTINSTSRLRDLLSHLRSPARSSPRVDVTHTALRPAHTSHTSLPTPRSHISCHTSLPTPPSPLVLIPPPGYRHPAALFPSSKRCGFAASSFSGQYGSLRTGSPRRFPTRT